MTWAQLWVLSEMALSLVEQLPLGLITTPLSLSTRGIERSKKTSSHRIFSDPFTPVSSKLAISKNIMELRNWQSNNDQYWKSNSRAATAQFNRTWIVVMTNKSHVQDLSVWASMKKKVKITLLSCCCSSDWPWMHIFFT